MKNLLIKNKWEYEIVESNIYGYDLIIYINDKETHRQGGFGSISMAEIEARDYFLLNEFNIERDNNE
jgi:hypothetical protein